MEYEHKLFLNHSFVSYLYIYLTVDLYVTSKDQRLFNVLEFMLFLKDYFIGFIGDHIEIVIRKFYVKFRTAYV